MQGGTARKPFCANTVPALGGAVVTVTTRQDAYDDALSEIRNHADDLGVWPAIWVNRSEADAHARRCASDAVDAIDAMLRDLHGIRARLVGEIRASDDATAARADALPAPQPGKEGAMTDGQRGPWTMADEPENCAPCGAHWGPGKQVRDDPDAGGAICACCGQEEPDEVPRMSDQLR